ncbi:unnamed protein product [Bathycoccus prasinos]|jgi:ribosomal protein L22|tara:strand:- start:4543 stop:5499 length:957 start_codon:yes stop_codon:yes gene_type:complete
MHARTSSALLSLLRRTGGRPPPVVLPFLLKRADNAAFFFRGDDDTDIVRKTIDFRSHFSSSSGMRFAAKNDKENDDENPMNTPKNTTASEENAADGEALPSPLQRAPMKKNQLNKHSSSSSSSVLSDQLGNLKLHPSVTREGKEKSEEVFYALKKNAKGSTKRFQAFLKILRGGITVEEALIQCKLSPKKKVANELYQIINSAKFNAVVGLGREPEDGYVDANCVISKATATKGQYLKRMYVKAKGQAGTMHRARTHIRVEVKEQEAGKRMRVFDPNDEERAKVGQEGKNAPPFEPPWITRRKLGEKRYRMAKEGGIL